MLVLVPLWRQPVHLVPAGVYEHGRLNRPKFALSRYKYSAMPLGGLRAAASDSVFFHPGYGSHLEPAHMRRGFLWIRKGSGSPGGQQDTGSEESYDDGVDEERSFTTGDDEKFIAVGVDEEEFPAAGVGEEESFAAGDDEEESPDAGAGGGVSVNTPEADGEGSPAAGVGESPRSDYGLLMLAEEVAVKAEINYLRERMARTFRSMADYRLSQNTGAGPAARSSTFGDGL